MNNNEHNQKPSTTGRPIADVAALLSLVAGLSALGQSLRTQSLDACGSQFDFTLDFTAGFTAGFTAAVKALPVLTMSAVPI
jgi:hypothetical protein